MNNELQKHKTSDTVKWVLTLIAFILVAVVLTGIILGWFDKKDDKPVDKAESEVVVTLPETGDGGVKLTKTMLTAAQYEDYGISPQAEGAFTITATAYDSTHTTNDAYNYFDFTIDWKTSNSAAVTDFIEMSVTDNTATFSCKKAFNTQIILTCTSTLKPDISATATFDYVRIATGFTYGTDNGIGVSSGTMSIHNGGMQKLFIDNADKYNDTSSKWDKKVYFYKGVGTWGDGTVNDTFTLSNVTITLTSGAQSAIASVGASANLLSTKSVTFTPEQVVAGISVKTLFNTGLTFDTASQTRKVTIMNALKNYSGDVYSVTINGNCAQRGAVACTITLKLDIAEVALASMRLSDASHAF